MNDTKLILVSIEFNIASVTLNRPEAMNALSTSMNEELYRVITKLQEDSEVRAVVINGAGERAFSAGADLKERRAMSGEEKWRHTLKLAETFNAIERMRVPVIAAIHGYALAGGCELALACDIRIAAEDAVFGLPETGIGIFPGAGGTVRLPRLIGKGKAKELIFSGRLISAREAQSIGLVEKVVPDSELLDESFRLARDISSKAPLAIQAAKELINHGLEMHLSEALELSNTLHQPLDSSKDYAEGLAAFVEKRNPYFTGQ